uniref:Prolamin-like domain-containing protein n=1 Tax=Chenopodium quinoa TaxID=63459 RepID=A0A803M211_CHEQI
MATTRSTTLVFLAITIILVTTPSPSEADILEFDIAPDDGIAPDSDIIYAPEPSKDPALMMCASKITLDCAAEILSNYFFEIHFEAKCCKQLVRMGKTCNDLIVDDIIAELDMNKTLRRILKCMIGVIIFGINVFMS